MTYDPKIDGSKSYLLALAEKRERGDRHYPPRLQDSVNHPDHYTKHPSGVECIQITEHMGFNLGNAVKYIWRCDFKHDAIEDLRKAAFYINREIARRMQSQTGRDENANQSE